MSTTVEQTQREARERLDTWIQYRARTRRWKTSETYAALALIAATVVALVWANTGHSYEHFWHTPTTLAIGPISVNLTIHQWVDEGLMAVFFFMVGLDVRRDLTLGELRVPSRAILPAGAAIGGLVMPALIFLAIMGGAEGSHAWGAVISTDTAFALGMLALIGPKRAPRLRLFLLAFAVIDDIGALAVIAVFYPEQLSLPWLALAAAGLLVVWLLARRGVWRSLPYVLLAVVIWYAVFRSGVHATLAGVLIALLMPVRSLQSRDIDSVGELAALYRQSPNAGLTALLRDALNYAIPMNQRLSWVLPPYSNYIVVPLFALANAGIVISGETLGAAFGSRILWAVLGGLILGKLLGVLLGAGLVMWLVPGSRMPGLDLPRMAGIGALSGMGFTISLLVANIALDDPTQGDQARLGVLLATIIAFLLAWAIFTIGEKLWPLPDSKGDKIPRPFDPEEDLYFGDPDAPTQIVQYVDQSYEHRWRLVEALNEIHPHLNAGLASLTYRYKVTGPESYIAALALEAVAEMEGPWDEKTWRFHDAMGELRGDVSSQNITQIARDNGIDAHRMWELIDSGHGEERILRDSLEVDGFVEDAAPIIYINGQRFTRVLNRWTLSQAIGDHDLYGAPDGGDNSLAHS
nr:Na+/H+ antiporter NhaA [Actinomyces sp.]